MNQIDLPSEDFLWDFVVVGAGSAGCVLANRLSESGTKTVLVLEAGPKDTPLMKPAAVSWFVDLSRFEWGYWSRNDPSRAMRREQWRRGKVIGGTSSINGMSFVRGSREDFNRWAALGNTGWAANDVMPLFQSMEHCEPGYQTQPNYSIRGNSGPLAVRQVRNCHPLTEAFIASGVSLGFPFNSDYNGANQEGFAHGQFNQSRGMRCSSADAFLKPVLSRKNLHVLTDAFVHKLEIFDGEAKGVIYECGGVRRTARGRKVILSGGAINTPKVLMLSGIGDAEHLRQHDIKVVLDRPGVGRNLMEHPLMRPTFRSRNSSYSPTDSWLQKIRFATKFILTGQGPIATPFEGMAFVKTSASEPVPDIQIHFCPMGIVYTNDPKVHKGLTLLPYPSFSFFVNKSHSKSRGRISLASGNPLDAPIIEPNLLGDERDVHTMVKALHLVRRIAAAAPLSDMILDEVEPGAACTTDEALSEYVRARTGLSYHPAGTCRMGTDDQAIVSPDLKVRGLENVWVADASIMPDHISGNINAVCMMIGEKLGRQLRN